MQTQAVIFDLFGTLIDNLRIPDYDRVMLEVAGVVGAAPEQFLKTWVDRYPQRAIGIPPTLNEGIRQICIEVGLNPTQQLIEQAADLRVEFTRRTMATRPDSLGLLAAVRARGLSTCLVSDCTWEVPMLWNDSPFDQLFDGAVFSCSVGYKKPDPRMYDSACDRLQVNPEQCLYVGDGCSNELTGALDIGMRAIQILAPHEDEEFYGIHSRQEWDGPLISRIDDVLGFLE